MFTGDFLKVNAFFFCEIEKKTLKEQKCAWIDNLTIDQKDTVRTPPPKAEQQRLMPAMCPHFSHRKRRAHHSWDIYFGFFALEIKKERTLLLKEEGALMFTSEKKYRESSDWRV